jgi:hypothetical protein
LKRRAADDHSEPVFLRLTGGFYTEAEANLREVLGQYQLSQKGADQTVGLSEGFVSQRLTDLALSIIPSANRRASAWGYHDNGRSETLSDMVLWCEAVVCNEAVSERTNSAMKRMLLPVHLRMSRDIQLFWLTISRHEGREREGQSSRNESV